MKRLKLLSIITLGGALVTALAWSALAYAQSFQNDIGQGTVVHGSVFAKGQNVTVAGTVEGDVYCVGQDVTISGTVQGDVICAGQTVTVSGTVDGSVRVAAQSLHVGSKVAHNVSLVGQNVHVDPANDIKGDAAIAGSSVTIDGPIGRDLVTAGNMVTLNSSVARNVSATVQNLTLGDSAKVGGDLHYTSNNNASIASSAQVAGKTTRATPTAVEHPNRSFFGIGLFFLVGMFFTWLVFAVVLAVLMPHLFRSWVEYPINRLGWTLLTGFLALFIVPALGFTLFVTVVGIPLAILLFLCWLIILMLSGPIAAYYIGSMVLARTRNALLIMLVGSLILLVLYAIPIVDVFAVIFALAIGVGAFLLEFQRRITRPIYMTPEPAVVSSKSTNSRKKT